MPEASVAVKFTVTVGLVRVAPEAGAAIVTTGPIVSTTNERDEDADNPFASIAVTTSVCPPSTTPVNVTGEAHEVIVG